MEIVAEEMEKTSVEVAMAGEITEDMSIGERNKKLKEGAREARNYLFIYNGISLFITVFLFRQEI